MKMIKHLLILCLLLVATADFIQAQNTSKTHIEFTCNACEPNEVRELLISKGFYKYPHPIKLQGIVSLLPGNDDANNRNGRAGVEDFAKRYLSYDTEEFNIADEIQTYIGLSPLAPGNLTGGFVTSNENLCANDNLFEQICGEFDDLGLAYWAHIWRARPDDNVGFLYVLGRSPATNGYCPTSSDHTTFINDGLAFINDDPAAYSYVKKYTQRSQVMFDLLADHTVTDYKLFSRVMDTDLVCDRLVDGAIGLAPSGIPIALENDAALRFELRPKLKGLVAVGALASFSIKITDPNNPTNPVRYDEYRGIFRPNRTNPEDGKHLGYIGTKTGIYYPSHIPIQQGSEYKVLIGHIDVVDNCRTYVIEEKTYIPQIIVNQIAEGIFTNNFDDTGDFKNGDLSSTIFEVCLPSVYLNEITNPQEVRFYEDTRPDLALYKVLDEYQMEKWIACYFEYDDPANATYLIWNSHLCKWQLYVPLEVEKIHFLLAVVKAFYETGHLSLELGGTLPVVGEGFDIVNGVWYSLEGNTSEALMSFASVVPWVSVIRVGGKLVFKSVNAGKDIVGLGKVIARTDGSKELVSLDKILAKADEIGIPEDLATILLKRLDQSDELLDLFHLNPSYLKGWKLLAEINSNPGAKRLWDPDLLRKTSELVSNNAFLTNLGEGVATTGRDILKQIIKNNERAPCLTCGTPSAPYLKFIHEYLDDVKHFTDTYPISGANAVPGASTIKSLLQNGHEYQMAASAQTLRMLAENPGKYGASRINRFEPNLSQAVGDGEFVGLNGVGDILLTNPILYTELKSYVVGTIDGIPSKTQFFNQLKAYATNADISDISKMEYIFDGRKLFAAYGGPFSSAFDAQNHIKNTFKVMFTDAAKGPDFFNAMNAQLRTSLGISNYAQFATRATDITDPLYDFIKVQ